MPRIKDKKSPAGFRLYGHSYIRLDLIAKVIEDAGKHSIADYKRQSEEALQKRLDDGANVDIRAYKSLLKENARNLKTLTNFIRDTVLSLEDEEEE